ncbi:hypothetical protein AA0535_1317 [Asaia krungthepensis NRIC 0535]|uniref:Uncharacterized protein n=1 Tax=Asaia krungthepensis NRIC 0535 TaxID=1307925 RepID=A0ABQ0Q201_9PROT|nr:hypothetical protein AA0535_1317 [Asaia krungthepensis NRIC 0535]
MIPDLIGADRKSKIREGRCWLSPGRGSHGVRLSGSSHVTPCGMRKLTLSFFPANNKNMK